MRTHIPNNIDAADFEKIEHSLLELKSKSLGHTSMLELIDQVIYLNNVVNTLFNTVATRHKDNEALAQESNILKSHSSHLSGHDQHLEAHDKHLVALTQRLDLLEKNSG